ncbi:MAG: elongation factor Ts [Clostridia bacterium]|nr:elongation factor Ts [Clostridia bacterium]
MEISAKTVAALRAKTGIGMMDCKKALVEANGNEEEAIKILREKGLAVAAKKSTRIAAEGLVSILLDSETHTAAMIEVNIETDFAAKNAAFGEFVNDLLKIILKTRPASVEELLKKEFADGLDVEAALKDKIFTIGENINIRRFVIIEGAAASYVHGKGNIGVVVKMDKVVENDAFFEAAKNVCLQAAAMNPLYLDPASVPADAIEKEKEIIATQIKNDEKNAKKPEAVIAKMVEGKLNKFYTINCLSEQAYVKDDKLTVAKYLASVAKEIGDDFKLAAFVRYEKGEGLEKREDNFAEEIAKLTSK